MSADDTPPVLNPTADDFPFDDEYSLEDNYEEFLRDELAYANMDWDDLDPEDVNQHDAILEMSLQALLEIDPEPLNDFQRWALARSARRHGNLDIFIKICALILDTPEIKQSKNLSYPNLRFEFARTLATAERFEDALREAEAYRVSPKAQPHLYVTLRGLILLTRGSHDEGIETLLNGVSTFARDEPELAVYIAEDLMACDLKPATRTFIERAILLITARGDHNQLDELRFLLSISPSA